MTTERTRGRWRSRLQSNENGKGRLYRPYCKGSGGILLVYACRAKGIFRKKNHSPLVGDVADFIVTHEGDKEGNIEVLHPRSSVLHRPTVANVDLGLVVFACKDPDPNLRLLDRMLVILEKAGLSAAICFNKTDLVDAPTRNASGRLYEEIGYPVVYACTQQGEGLDSLRSLLQGHLATVAGPSGAGKSSLVNALSGHRAMEVGEISAKIRRGKQTTRHVELVELPDGNEDSGNRLENTPDGNEGSGNRSEKTSDGNEACRTFLVDTPGFSNLEFGDLKKEALAEYFPEIWERTGHCRFPSCSHIYEPVAECGVRQSV